MSHTILLVQPGNRPETRTYSDYESVNECLEGICKIYEEHLKRRNPNAPKIKYDISQLFDFIDQLPDLSCLVYQKSTNTYAPNNKNWIKAKIYVLLRRAAEQKRNINVPIQKNIEKQEQAFVAISRQARSLLVSIPIGKLPTTTDLLLPAPSVVGTATSSFSVTAFRDLWS